MLHQTGDSGAEPGGMSLAAPLYLLLAERLLTNQLYQC